MVLIKSVIDILQNKNIKIKNIQYGLYGNVYVEDKSVILNNFYSTATSWLNLDYTFESNHILHMKIKDDRLSGYNQMYVNFIVDVDDGVEKKIPFFLIRNLKNVEIYKTNFEKDYLYNDNSITKYVNFVENEVNWIVLDLRDMNVQCNFLYAPNYLLLRKGQVDHRHFHTTGSFDDIYVIRDVSTYFKPERAYRCLMSRGLKGEVRNPLLGFD